MFKGKTVVLGVTGSIAAYKIADLASSLVKKGCDVNVIMTKNATNFINPITFEELSGNKCITDTFDRNFQHSVTHISLAVRADAFLVAPASANVIGKIANGIADDMLTTTIMASKCPKIIAPAMNTNMFENQIVQDNLAKLNNYGYTIIPPDEGRLACGAVGKGKLPSTDILLDYLELALCDKKDLQGKKILVTAGPTQEKIDPVRYITNHSSGKMGYAIAKNAMLRGADVTLVSGPVNIKPLSFVNTVNVVSAQDMFDEVTRLSAKSDIIIMSAAVADFRPAEVSEEKIKKSGDTSKIELERTKDILKYLGENKKENQIICGFSMETENMLENSTKKLKNKNADMIICNNLKDKGAGFKTDTNKVTIIDKNNVESLELMSKSKVADEILDRISKLI